MATEAAALPQSGVAQSGGALTRRQRAIVTPEGVPLVVELADRGSRAAAFIIDLVFIILIMVAAGIGLALSEKALDIWAFVIAVLGFFLLRIFYFPVTELFFRGATPGKRLLGLRVIDRHGGPLKPEAVVVRN